MGKTDTGAVKIGRYTNIGIAVDDDKVVYVNLLTDGTVSLRWVVDRAFIENRDVHSISSKSDKQYLVTRMTMANGFSLPGMNLAKMVYETHTGSEVGSGQVMHHKLGQFICLPVYLEKMDKKAHDALHRLNAKKSFKMSVEEFFLNQLSIKPEQYYGIFRPNLGLILSEMLEGGISSNFVAVSDVCLYEVRLDSIDNWRELITTK